MADNNTKINGDNISGNRITGPGEIQFAHKVGDVTIPNYIIIPPEYFQEEPIEIKLNTNLNQVTVGDNVRLDFEITSGYPNSFAVILSVEGDDNSKYHILAERILYNFIDKKSSITFAVPDSPSNICFVKVVGLDENDKVLAVSNHSNQFEIISPINVTLTINPIKPRVKTEEEIEVRFELKPSNTDIDSFVVALTIDQKPHQYSTLQITDTKIRSFKFKIPNQTGKKCRLGIIAIKGNQRVVGVVSNEFEIIPKGLNPQVNPTINLIEPKVTDDLHVNGNIDIRFELIPRTFIAQILNISYSTNKSLFINIHSFNNYNDSADLSWTIPQCTQFWLRFEIPQVMEKTFGPFTIGNKVVITQPAIITCSKLDDLLSKGLSIPRSNLFRSRKGRILNVSQFASYLVYSKNSNLRTEIVTKVPVILKFLEELDSELQTSNYSSTHKRNSDVFNSVINSIKNNIRRFLIKSDEKYFGIKGNLDLDLMRRYASYLIEDLKSNEAFVNNFNKNFKPQFKSQTWEMIYQDPQRLAFVLETGNSMGIESAKKLYDYYDLYYNKLIELNTLFNQMKKIISLIKKDLKSQ